MFGGSNICRQLLGLAISEFNDACVGNFPNYSKYLIFGTHAAIAAVRLHQHHRRHRFCIMAKGYSHSHILHNSYKWMEKLSLLWCVAFCFGMYDDVIYEWLIALLLGILAFVWFGKLIILWNCEHSEKREN